MTETAPVETAPAAQSLVDVVKNPVAAASEIVKEAAKEAPKDEIKEIEIKPEPKEDATASKFAALEKKAAAIRSKEMALKNAEAQTRSRLAELEAELAKAQSLRKMAKENPWDYLKAADLDYNYLTEYALNNQKPPVETKLAQVEHDLQEKLQAYIKPLEEKLRVAEEREASAKLHQFKADISQHLAAKTDDYEMIVANDAQEMVFETINQYAEQHGKLLAIDQAAKMVEDFLTEQARAILPKVTKAKKLQDLLSIPQKIEPAPNKTVVPQTPTLSNKMAEAPQRAEKALTHAERMAEAARMIKFTND
jgi:hypothetical protein